MSGLEPGVALGWAPELPCLLWGCPSGPGSSEVGGAALGEQESGVGRMEKVVLFPLLENGFGPLCLIAFAFTSATRAPVGPCP